MIPHVPAAVLLPAPAGPVLDWVRRVMDAADAVIAAMAKWVLAADETRRLAAEARAALAAARDKTPDLSGLDGRTLAVLLVVGVVGWAFAKPVGAVVAEKLLARWSPKT